MQPTHTTPGAVLRRYSSGVQCDATPGTVELIQLRTVDAQRGQLARLREIEPKVTFLRGAALAAAWRSAAAMFGSTTPCAERDGLPAVESDGPTVAIAAAAGTVLAAAFIFVIGGAA